MFPTNWNNLERKILLSKKLLSICKIKISPIIVAIKIFNETDKFKYIKKTNIKNANVILNKLLKMTLFFFK